MAHSAPFPTHASARAKADSSATTASVPWYVWCAVFAVTSAMIGGHWDISWHRSIGRDTFWTPAHIAIYLCGVLAGISCGYLILSTTFGRSSFPSEATVRLWGFRGPLGAFIAAWGGVAMLTSAPFDDWWHSAYGLDVKIVSPPHVVLIVGILAAEVGALILVLGQMNRAEGKLRARLNWIFLYLSSMILVILTILTMEYIWRPYMHSGFFYRTVATFIPIVLAGIALASERRWAATTSAGFYMLFMIGMLWILPLFPAEPKLGPVYTPVKHFIPAEFPLLLIVPAFFIDLLLMKTKSWRRSLQAVVGGAGFVATFAAAQWPFGNFLMSPLARNWFFGTAYFDYNSRPESFYRRYVFFDLEKTSADFWMQMALAILIGMIMVRLGLAWGAWMQRIQR